MTLQRKICLVGGFAVGKTSLVRQFVHSQFSDKYLTTVGVKVDRKDVEVDGQPVRLLVWDIAGQSDSQEIRASYLRGAAGFLVVADGTRRDTVDRARVVTDIARETTGDVPVLLCVNKADLSMEWDVSPELLDDRWGTTDPRIETSAKDGRGVDEAFHALTQRILA